MSEFDPSQAHAKSSGAGPTLRRQAQVADALVAAELARLHCPATHFQTHSTTESIQIQRIDVERPTDLARRLQRIQLWHPFVEQGVKQRATGRAQQ